MVPPRFKQESRMNTDMRELSVDELDQVSGGKALPVPGGTVESHGGMTIMKFGNTTITVEPDGSIYTSTKVPAPA